MTWAEGDPNPFIDREGYLAHIDMQEQRFLEMLAEQRAPPVGPPVLSSPIRGTPAREGRPG